MPHVDEQHALGLGHRVELVGRDGYNQVASEDILHFSTQSLQPLAYGKRTGCSLAGYHEWACLRHLLSSSTRLDHLFLISALIGSSLSRELSLSMR